MKSKLYNSLVLKSICFILIVVFMEKTVFCADEKEQPKITANSAVVIDVNTGAVIFEKNILDKKYPASITKVMTALLALEHSEGDLSKRIKFSHNAVFSIPYGSSHIAMDEDETLTMEEALYAILLPSANEVANAIAEHISGSVDEFAVLMTNKAKELGAYNTNFLNPHGLHEENHYTTAIDMALIMKEALRHPKFIEIIGTNRYEIPPTEKQEESRIILNSNKMIQKGTYYNEYVVGGKTGFTDEAMHTLISYAKDGDKELVVVILEDEKSKPYEDTDILIEYGFNQFETVNIFDKNEFSKSIGIYNNVNMLELKAEKSLELNIPKAVKDEIKIEESIPSDISKSVKKGDKIGEVKVLVNDVVLGKVNILCNEDVKIIENNIEEVPKQVVENKVELERNEENTLLKVGIIVSIFIISLLIGSFRSRPKSRIRRNYLLTKPVSRKYKYRE